MNQSWWIFIEDDVAASDYNRDDEDDADVADDDTDDDADDDDDVGDDDLLSWSFRLFTRPRAICEQKCCWLKITNQVKIVLHNNKCFTTSWWLNTEISYFQCCTIFLCHLDYRDDWQKSTIINNTLETEKHCGAISGMKLGMVGIWAGWGMEQPMVQCK